MPQATNEQYNLLIDVLAAADLRGDKLNDWEKTFLTDYAEKEAEYSDKINMSDKQENVLNKIQKKLDE